MPEGIFMTGKQDKQIQMIILDIDSIIPKNHLPRRIKNYINFEFIYEKASPYYAKNSRKSMAPIILIKMLLIGYLYGIKFDPEPLNFSQYFRELL